MLNQLLFQKTSSSISILDTSCELLAFISEFGLLLSIILQSQMSWSRILQGLMIIQYSIARISLFRGGGIDINQIINGKGQMKKKNKKTKGKRKNDRT